MLSKRETYLITSTDAKSKLLEKALAPHSSTLAWKIPWMDQEPSKLQSMESLRVRHN